jgi:hypothetical protein
VAAAVLGSVGCGEQSAALRVGDETVSRADLFDELELITTNEEFRAITIGEDVPLSELQGSLRTSYTQNFVAAILNQRIRYLLASQALEANDLEVTGADRDRVVQQINDLLAERGVADGANSLPRAYRRELVEGLARLTVLEETLGGQEAGNALREAAQVTDIDVNSQFGSWNEDTLSIDPPPGPAGASDDGEAGTGPG